MLNLSAIDFGQFRLQPAFFFSSSANFDFGQIDFGQFLDVKFWDDKVWALEGWRGAPKGGGPKPRKSGAPKGGAQKGGAQKGGARRVGPEGWGQKGGAPKGWSPEGWGPEGWGPEGWGAQNFALFLPFPATVSLFLYLSWGLFVEFCWCLKRRNPEICTFGVLGLSCASPGGPVDCCMETMVEQLFAMGPDQANSKFDAVWQVFCKKFEAFTPSAQMPGKGGGRRNSEDE